MEKEPVCDWLPPIWPSQGDRGRNDAFKKQWGSLQPSCASLSAVLLLHCCQRSFMQDRHWQGFISFMTPHPGFPKPWINWDGLWARWRLRNLRPHTSTGHTAVSSGPYFKSRVYYYLGGCRLSWYSTAFTKGSDAIGGVNVWNNLHQDAFAKEYHSHGILRDSGELGWH